MANKYQNHGVDIPGMMDAAAARRLKQQLAQERLIQQNEEPEQTEEPELPMTFDAPERPVVVEREHSREALKAKIDENQSIMAAMTALEQELRGRLSLCGELARSCAVRIADLKKQLGE